MECMKNGFVEGALLNGRFLTVKLLNQGSFGMVHLAKDTMTNRLVAVKCLLKASASNSDCYGISYDELSEELENHSALGHHPNIVNLISSFETESHTFLVLEYCPMGDLYEAIRVGRGPLETEHVRDFMLQLVAAVEHMHSCGVFHRDIKPENIFLSQDGRVKLGDFGLATSEDWTYEDAVGSDRYMAPEQYDAFRGYSPEQADIWAIGICLLNVLFARNPFITPTMDDPIFADFVHDPESLFDVFPTLSEDTFEVLGHCLSIHPAGRSLADVREAIMNVRCWTTDDEGLDEFCAEGREVILASVDREPLRTPSIQQTHIAEGASFPWAQALQASPAQQPCKLEVIEDREDSVCYSETMFADSPDNYAKNMADYAAPISSYDSGLGASVCSGKSLQLRSDRIQIQKSASADSSIPCGKPEALVSKSWSDLFDEDEEEEEREKEIKARKRLSWSDESDPGFGDDDDFAGEWIGGEWEDLAVV